MNNILIIFAHPAKSHSVINHALRSAVENLDGVTVNDLYSHYPDFMIDIEREKALCEAHDIIIFQHPLYWYSTPSIMKEWLDLVLEHGWAYGHDGEALKGKFFLQAFSAGGDASSYHKEGANGFSLEALTTPLQATVKLCNMQWLPPFAVMGVHRGLPYDKVQAHAEDYRRLLMALRDAYVDLDSAKEHTFLNSDLNRIIKRP